MVFRARNSAFSAPRICTVEAGHLASEVRDPAFWIRRAATVSPIRADRLGATVAIFSSRYVYNCFLYSARDIIRSVRS